MTYNNKNGDFIRPVFRKAKLMKISPIPKRDDANRFAQLLKKDWENSSKESYIETLINKSEEIDKIRCSNSEGIHIRDEGKSIVIDYPRFKGLSINNIKFETRTCIAICLENFSTKIWSRIGFPCKKFPLVKSFPQSKYKSLVSLFHKINDINSRWAYEKLVKIVNRNVKSKHVGTLEVITLGVQEKQLVDHLNKLSDYDIKTSGILKNSEVDDQISKYFNQVYNRKTESIFKLLEKDPDSRWFCSPTIIENKNGDIEEKKLLYFIHKLYNSVRVFGIGHDNSFRGDLSQRSSLNVAYWLGTQF